MAADPGTEGFTYVHYADGSVVISHDGNAATLLLNDRAAMFLTEVEVDDLQEVAARWTSKYRPGVKMAARPYPRKPISRPTPS